MQLVENVKNYYRWMPAGLNYEALNKAGIAIYVKYRSGENKIKVLHKAVHSIHISCPDRELLICGDQVYAHPYYPANGWDEVVYLDPFHHHTYEQQDMPFYMVNYTDFFDDPTGGSNHRKNHPRTPGEPYIVADSGGFQISVGICDYVDPTRLIQWYNNNVDLGMVLDIPCKPSIVGHSNFLKLAKLQKKNTDTLLAGKRKDLELFNVFHGETKDTVNQYREIVEDEKIDRLAVGSIARGDTLLIVDKVFSTILTGKAYKHYHALGISKPATMSVFSYMSRHPRIQVLTSDSSTPIQLATGGTYLTYHYMEKPFDQVQLGMAGGFNAPSTHNKLNCSCTVCSTLKYADIFGLLNGGMLMFGVLVYHNTNVLAAYQRTLFDALSGMNHAEAIKFIKQHFNGRKSLQETVTGINFVEDIMQTSYEKAAKKYSFHLSESMFNTPAAKQKASAGNTLFQDVTEVQDEPAETKKDRAERLLKIYATGKGKQTKSKIGA